MRICLTLDHFCNKMFLPQGAQGLPGKPVRSLPECWPWLWFILSLPSCLFKFCRLQNFTEELTTLIKSLCCWPFDWHEPTGRRWWPWLSGTTGSSRSKGTDYLLHDDYFSCVCLFTHWPGMFCGVLKQGEPGVGEKGERGMDGLPGLKVIK